MIAPRLVSLVGLFAMIGLAWLMSSRRGRLPWRMIFGGLALQFAFAAVVMWTTPGRWFFDSVGTAFNQLLGFVEAGASFVFNVYPREGETSSDSPPFPPHFLLLRSFAFGVLPTIIFFSSLMAILYHIGVMQWVVSAMARVMQFTLGASGAESLSAAANVFVGHTEAPLVIRPYLGGLTRSELNAVMVGGFATVTGGLMAAYVRMGVNAGHLMTASVISAPAALLIAKVMEPETETPKTRGGARVEIPRTATNVVEAAAIGASDGLKLALNVGAMLIAFLGLIAMLDAIVAGAGWALHFRDSAGQSTWSLARLLGSGFAPIAWLMGVEWSECSHAGELLGLKMVANELIAYERLGTFLHPESPVKLSPRTVTIMTYALCGFSNFGAIAIQIGGIGSLVPERRADLAQLGLRAMFGGTLACCMTACIAGVMA